jgi:hypothetical protein
MCAIGDQRFPASPAPRDQSPAFLRALDTRLRTALGEGDHLGDLVMSGATIRLQTRLMLTIKLECFHPLYFCRITAFLGKLSLIFGYSPAS